MKEREREDRCRAIARMRVHAALDRSGGACRSRSTWFLTAPVCETKREKVRTHERFGAVLKLENVVERCVVLSCRVGSLGSSHRRHVLAVASCCRHVGIPSCRLGVVVLPGSRVVVSWRHGVANSMRHHVVASSSRRCRVLTVTSSCHPRVILMSC